MEKQIQAAQQQVADAQNGRSEAEQQAAMKHLQQVQLDQAEKLKQSPRNCRSGFPPSSR